jgi:hypothetical protein
MVLPMAFWFSALYGAASCPLADTYLHQFNYDKQQTRLFAANMQEPMPCYASLCATRWTQTQVFSTWFE